MRVGLIFKLLLVSAHFRCLNLENNNKKQQVPATRTGEYSRSGSG